MSQGFGESVERKGDNVGSTYACVGVRRPQGLSRYQGRGTTNNWRSTLSEQASRFDVENGDRASHTFLSITLDCPTAPSDPLARGSCTMTGVMASSPPAGRD
ncbi:unnamed protein product [Cyclocybe aegerita]|uniref:Uncharacterized protein n=1 Tax=Cyclocybe aegerita TaxID=1973307 RepID=A0A8S0W4J9_CYCAE|nr:unnamed protein product [Cyclocybe aegerita]